ncbi:MAG: hypothetical protein V9E94_14125 [Microthrixaceae bacterium]
MATVGDVDIAGVEESELERRFKVALRRVGRATAPGRRGRPSPRFPAADATRRSSSRSASAATPSATASPSRRG